MCKGPSILQLASVLLLSCYFICPFDCGCGAISLSVPQREVCRIVNQSVNLSVSYSTLTPYSTLKILWYLLPGDTAFVTLIRSNCSPDAARSRYNCSDHQVSAPSHQHRVHLDPETGSLCLRDLQPNDSGVYVIQVYRDGADTAIKGNVTLTVCNETDCGCGAISLSVPQREVCGIVNQSVNLSVSYSTLQSYSTLKILWYLLPGDTAFVTLIRSNCSPDAARSRYNCSDHQVSAPSYQHRVHLDPETGSLCLRDLQLNDSGVYVIQVYRDGADTAIKGNVTLTVCNETDGESTTPAVSTTSQSSTESRTMYISISAAVCFFIVLICFIYLLVTKKHKGCRPQHDSVVMETSVQSIEGMRQGLTEGQDTLSNSDLTYSLLQWSKDRNPQASGVDPRETGLETVYAFPRMVNCR